MYIKVMIRIKYVRIEVVLLYKINRILVYFCDFIGNNFILIE